MPTKRVLSSTIVPDCDTSTWYQCLQAARPWISSHRSPTNDVLTSVASRERRRGVHVGTAIFCRTITTRLFLPACCIQTMGPDSSRLNPTTPKYTQVHWSTREHPSTLFKHIFSVRPPTVEFGKSRKKNVLKIDV